jgi:hypothetical protein
MDIVSLYLEIVSGPKSSSAPPRCSELAEQFGLESFTA